MITIRPTTEQDATAVAYCLDRIARERQFLASTEGISVEQIRDYIMELLVWGTHHVLLDNTRVVGWCDATSGIFEGLTHVGHLTIGLLPDYRRKGWGRKLLLEALASGFAEKFERVDLEVFASNIAAIQLYRKAGFVEEGRKRNARKLDGKYDDLILFGMLREEWKALKAIHAH
jgi:RimJ/RimL family protein N-acetyltransferase